MYASDTIAEQRRVVNILPGSADPRLHNNTQTQISRWTRLVRARARTANAEKIINKTEEVTRLGEVIE